MAITLREVTIGRSANCDIYLDQGCKYASGMHGTIYYDGGQLMFRDSSTNGTWINNIKIHKRAVPIHHGDIIMIAGRYQINWNQIDAFFPPISTPLMLQQGTMIAATPSAVAPTLGDVAVDTSKFSWGAFALSGIWGFFNGCWWMFFVNIGFGLLGLIPVVNIFSAIASLVTNIMFGVYGTRWAWTNRKWSSPNDFIQTQTTWNKVGKFFFIASIVLLFCFVIFFLVSILAYL